MVNDELSVDKNVAAVRDGFTDAVGLEVGDGLCRAESLKATEVQFSNDAPNDAPNGDPQDAKKQSVSGAAAVLSPMPMEKQPIVINDIPLRGLYITPEGELFVSYEQDAMLQVASVKDRRFKRYIRQIVYQKTAKVLTDSAIRDYVDQIAAACDFCGEKIKLFNRTARDGGDIVVDGVSVVYRISAGKWVEEKLNTPIFKRPPGMLDLAKPTTGGDLKKLLRFVNIRNEEGKILFLVHLVASLIEDIPHPPLICYGPQGSSKSSLLRYYCSLIDPMLAEDVPFRNEKEFMLTANQRWVMGMDNVSFLERDVSDLFCKLVTGACYTARVLYTDEDLLIRRFRRVVLINGINLPVDKPDLMDRCILMPLDRVPSDQRLPESVLNEQFEALRGELLGACFDALAKAIEIKPMIKLTSFERMADFQVWGCAIAQALGYTQEAFLGAWAKNVELQNEESIDSSPLAALVIEWFKKNRFQNNISGTPTQVFRQLKSVAEEAGIDERIMPKTPLAFGRKLQEVRSNLEAHGFVIDKTRGKDRMIAIYRPKSPVPVASMPSFPSDAINPFGASLPNVEMPRDPLSENKPILQ